MPSINKVVYGNRTLLDLTNDTVTAATMLSGATAHDASGENITGTFAVETNKAVTVSDDTVITPSSGYNAMAQVTVTVDKTKHYYATITKTGRTSYAYVVYPSSTGTTYYTAGDKFEIQAGQTIYMYANGSRTYGQILVNDEVVAGASASGGASYEYTVKKCDVEISLTYGNPSLVELIENASTLNITTNGDYDVSEYDIASVNVAGGITITDEANTTGTTCVITTSSQLTPSETWETVYNNSTNTNSDTPYNNFWLSSLSDVYPTIGSVWRFTVNGTNEYRCTAYSMNISNVGQVVCVGNPLYSGGTDDGTGTPFNFYNAGWGAWVGDTELTGTYFLKIEQLVTE